MPADTQIKARPTLYKGIQMRSRLEADYAALLDGEGSTWEYEPTCFAADGVQWLPDFRITWTGTARKFVTYVEVKPDELMNGPGSATGRGFTSRVDAILRQMSVAWESEPDAGLRLVIHRYGRQWPDFEVFGSPEEPWTCADNLTPNAMLLIWPGMGQKAALRPAPESAREARRSGQ